MKLLRLLLLPFNLVHSILFWLFFVVLTAIMVNIGWILSFILKTWRKRDEVLYSVARLWARIILAAAAIRIERHHDPDIVQLEEGEARLYLCNHQGGFDIPILMACLPRFAFVAKQELFKAPLFGPYMRALGFVSIHREGIKGADDALKQAASRLSSGLSLIMFPEGTRTATGKLGRFRRGPLKAAVQSGVKIQPCAIEGSYRTMRKGSLFIRPGKVHFYASHARHLPEEMDRVLEGRICEELREETAEMLRT